LFYNAMGYPTSDDATMTSVTVGKPATNRVEFVPKANSYFYTQFPCVNAKNKYTGISLRIKAPKGATLSVQLDSSDNCDPTNPKSTYASATDLGWTFDGTEKLYTIPFSKFAGLNTEKLTTILFSGFSGTTSFGPMAFYCGNSGEYVVPPTSADPGASATVPAPSNPSATALVIDKFANANTNAMGNWHGGDEGMTLKYASGKLTITSPDADYSFYTQVSGGCADFTKYKGSYLHIAYTGTTAFTVAFQQHNSQCKTEIAPFPETWDSAEASRYAKNGHIYIPINHFNIELSRVVGFALKGFHTTESVTLSVIEIVSSVPAGTTIPKKDETGNLVFACKRPNSFAFAIDDGQPDLAQEVLKIIREENVKVTFFTVGAPLLDASTNLTNVYKEMMAAGHQLALHSFTHPKMEGLPDYAAIDWEYNEDVKAMKSQFNGYTSTYFRPPFGNEGARMRSRLTKAVGNTASIVNWSVDVEDWLWAETDTPEQQKVAFQRDVDKGGNLVVLHYLYPSTVSYLREFIQIAKATGKQLMRVDQCMMDPNAPPL
jgi:peptidoglycan/xylan/chitin deacetylase (PgdA/CDA1 family)